MLEFRNIDISDKPRIDAALAESQFMGCEYSFANNMAWRRLAESKIAFFRDFYICCAFGTDDGIPHFMLPAGKGNYREVIDEMKRFTDSMGVPLVITGVTDNFLPVFAELYPDAFTITSDRDSSDYIYNSSDLINLSGKKYHGKRNHLARFNKLGCTYSPMTENDFDDCITFGAVSYNNKLSENDHSFVAEQFAINTYFSYFSELGLKGGIIRKDGCIAAFTVGEPINRNTFCIHIEKADTSFDGIYAGINNCFARDAAAEYRFINREEDLGIEGLRKSKLSYYPAFILNKNTIVFK